LLALDFYKKINEQIKATNLTTAEFARRVGVSRDTVYNLSEKTAISTYFKIIEVLGKKPEDFFKPMNDYEKLAKLTHIAEEAETFGEVNYKQKYYETLEKLNLANERIMAFTDQKKDLTKNKK
jgi:DNA-binding XRE family transcriptional regulator